MRLKKYCILLPMLMAFLVLAGIRGSAQGYYFYNNGYYESDWALELGLGGGVMNGMTDVGGSKNGRANSGFMGDFTVTRSRSLGCIYAVATYRDWLGLRLGFSMGQLQAADSSLKGTKSKWAEGRYVRNLSFKTDIMALGLGAEIHPRMWKNYEDREPPKFSPYLVADASWLKFNPTANLDGVWYDLQPLRLEGQGFEEYPDREPYKTHTFELAYGFGLRYEISPLFNIRLEMMRHSTLTDYLDDVSQENWVDPALFSKYLTPSNAAVARQLYNRSTLINPPRNTRPRGKSADNDAFWSACIKIGINLNRLGNNNGSGNGFGKKVKCPGAVL